MKHLARKMRSPVKTHGGKAYLARRIIALFPEHKTYVEPFAGGLNVLLNKPRAEIEVACDLNDDLFNFFAILQRRPDVLVDLANQATYDEDTFLRSKRLLKRDDVKTLSTDRAFLFLVVNRMSRGGLGKDFAWSDRLRGGQPGDVNAWKTMADGLPAVADRLKGVRLHPFDFRKTIALYSSVPGALFYCDPPYLHETRTAKSTYNHELAREDHADLLTLLKGVSGKVFLSGYRSALYDDSLKDWRRHEFEIANHSGQGKSKQRRIECVWESPN